MRQSSIDNIADKLLVSTISINSSSEMSIVILSIGVAGVMERSVVNNAVASNSVSSVNGLSESASADDTVACSSNGFVVNGSNDETGGFANESVEDKAVLFDGSVVKESVVYD